MESLTRAIRFLNRALRAHDMIRRGWPRAEWVHETRKQLAYASTARQIHQTAARLPK